MATPEPASREELEDLFENAPCGYVSADAGGKLTRVNATLLGWLGFDRDAIVGKRFSELLGFGAKIFYETHFAPMLRMQGRFDEVALDLVCSDGSSLPVIVNALEVRDAAGKARLVRITLFRAPDRRRYEKNLLDARSTAEESALLSDARSRELAVAVEDGLQERQQLEEALRQSQKLESLGQLTGGIAHDFNNLLTGITGSVDMVRRRLPAGRLDDVYRYLDVVSASTQRAAALTHRLLAFARRQSLDTKPADVNRVVAGMEELLLRTLGENVGLEVRLTPDCWPALTDANQFENALLNLAINARDAMPDGGRLTIETANTQLDATYAPHHDGVVPGDYVAVCVSDTGSGMPADVIRLAFDPFFTTKPVGQGTGLGLSMIYGFMKQTGGHARIYSEVGRGTTIKLYLPRADAREATAAVGPSAPRGSGETILVVEDDPAVRMLMTEVLDELGYRFHEASDADGATAILASGTQIDLLITDVGLPGINGRQLAEIARAQRLGLKVLFVTGYAETAAVRGGFLEAGMEMVTKPFALDAFAAKIRAILGAAEG